MNKFVTLLVLACLLLSTDMQAKKKLGKKLLIQTDTLKSDSIGSDSIGSVLSKSDSILSGTILPDKLQSESIPTKGILPDSTQAFLTGVTDTLGFKSFKPNPLRVVWMGAIIPGYGQILNRKYWKLPIVYGGFLTCGYFISWNSNLFQTYKSAYRDIIDSDPTTKSYEQTVPPGYTIESIGLDTYTASLKTKQDYYRRYRDLSIILSVGFYAITIVDAYVDAQLYDFDISPELSLKFLPVLMHTNYNSMGTLGIKCKLLIK